MQAAKHEQDICTMRKARHAHRVVWSSATNLFGIPSVIEEPDEF